MSETGRGVRRRGGARGVRRAVSTALALSAAGALAACTSQAPQAVLPVVPAPASSQAAAQDAPEASVATSAPSGEGLRGVAPGDDLPADTFVSDLQAAHEAYPTVRLRLKMSGASALAADADIDSAADRMRVVTSDGVTRSDLEVVAIGEDVWLFLEGLGGEGTWFALTPEEIESWGIEDLAASVSYEQMWSGWTEGARNVKYVGSATVNGESVDHYALSVDLVAALEATGAAVPEAATGPNAFDTVRYDVYLDDRDLMRLVEFDIAGQSASITLFDWGEALDIEPPEDPKDYPF